MAALWGLPTLPFYRPILQQALCILRRERSVHLVPLGLQEGQEDQHHHDANGERQDAGGAEVDQQAGRHIGQEGDDGAGDGVGQLGGNMVHMVALSTGRGHDGGIGDGGAVVTAHRAGHAGGDTDDAQRVLQGEDGHGDGDQETTLVRTCVLQSSL